MNRRPLTLAAAVLAGGLVLSGCAQESSTSSSSSAAPESSSAAPESSSPAESPSSDACAKENLVTVTPGTLTIGTDKPAYPPYFVDDDPSNGKGFESAVAYAVAEGLGYTTDEVTWTVVPFNTSYAPGDKNFDFDINQISITPERQKAVDFSDGYYTVNQAVVALKDSPIADATTLEQLKTAKLGAQVGTTSLTYIDEYVQPEAKPFVYNDTNDAKSALENGQIDGIVVDLPTAYYITAAEIDNSKIVGQFPAQEGPDAEQFGLLFAKGNPLVECVNQVLAELKSTGDLEEIQNVWLAGDEAPYFQQ
ncbi:MAG: ABC transporter substrate-binding protein [Candidatus Nanopelagicales bacterium]